MCWCEWSAGSTTTCADRLSLPRPCRGATRLAAGDAARALRDRAADLHDFLQAAVRAMKPDLDRVYAHAQQPRDFRRRERMRLVEQDRGSIAIGQVSRQRCTQALVSARSVISCAEGESEGVVLA